MKRQMPAPEGFIPFPVDFGFIGMAGPVHVKAGSKNTVMGFRVEEKHLNPGGICHGGMMMAVADMAVGLAGLLASGRRISPPFHQQQLRFSGAGQARRLAGDRYSVCQGDRFHGIRRRHPDAGR
jgi:hypothetical protein